MEGSKRTALPPRADGQDSGRGPGPRSFPRAVAGRREGSRKAGPGPGCHMSHLLKEEKTPMPSQKRRAAGRRRAWGRGPIILRFESLEGRQLLTAPPKPLPDLVGAVFATTHNLDWGSSFHAV